MSIELYPSIAKIKRNGVYENLPGFVPETGSIATQQMIATAESSATAQYVHNKGEYFRLNDTLYQAIVKINVGDAVVVGTNCEVAVIGNDLTHVANSIAAYELGIATISHNTGDYFMVGETLYVATADIQVGDNISTSTNCRKAVVGDELSGLKTATTVQSSILSSEAQTDLPFTIIDDKYINANTGAINSTGNGWSATDYIDVTKFNLVYYRRTAHTTSSPVIGMAFYDATKTYISGNVGSANKPVSGYTEGLVARSVPTNAVYARFTTRKDVNTYGEFVVKGQSKFFSTNQNISPNVEEIATETLEFNYYIKYDDGRALQSSSTRYYYTNYVDISDFEYLTYTSLTVASSANNGMAFYDDEKTYIYGVQSLVDTSIDGTTVDYYYQPYTIKVPQGAKYARFTIFADTTTYGNFELYGIRKMYGLIDKQWKNKKWYAYGTSITASGNYTAFVANMLECILTNKGISNGALVWNTDVKNAVMNITDGKLEADLITLEIGANDRTETLGTIYDTGDSTFCGALNQCIRYLQENTNAQIVVLSSPVRIYNSGHSDQPTPPEYQLPGGYTAFEQAKAIEDVCKVNGVYYIPMQTGLGFGYSRINNTKYVSDHIHPTVLGGFNLANGIYEYLKRIPLWYHSRMGKA